MDVVSEGELRRARAAGVPADKIIFAGVGKTREEMAYALRRGHSRLQRGVRARARGPERGGGGPRPHGLDRASASIPTSMPRRTPRSRPARPRTSSACRSRMRRGSMPRPPSCRASPSPASTCTSAARSPTWQPFRNAFTLMRELASTLRADGHDLTPSRSRRRPRRALRLRQRGAALAAGIRAGRARDAGIARPRARAGAGPHDRRQRRRAGGARDLRQARAATRPSPSSMRP